MLRVSARMSVDLSPKVYRELVELVGEADANALLLHQGRAAEPERSADLLLVSAR